jgi:hypothetical protein
LPGITVSFPPPIRLQHPFSLDLIPAHFPNLLQNDLPHLVRIRYECTFTLLCKYNILTKQNPRRNRQGFVNKVQLQSSRPNKLSLFEPFKGSMFLPRQERDMEVAPFGIIIGPAPPGELDRCPHIFEELQVIIKTAFGDPNLLGAIGRRAGTLVRNKVIEADQAVK